MEMKMKLNATLRPLRMIFLGCATLALGLAAGPAFAHAHLLSEIPASDDATAAAAVQAGPVTEFRLSFSEGLNLAFSKAKVTDGSGKTVESSAAPDPKDAKVLVVTFKSALPGGEYTVDWTAVAADGHKTAGTYKVKVAQ
jgi:methionine-rich copper-binding protein CopC